MNIQKLQEAAHVLRAEIAKLSASDWAAARLGVELENFIAKAEQCTVLVPVQWRDIPGNYLFTEEGLQQYAALEQAFSIFCIELTGGETPVLRRLKEQMGEVEPRKF